MEYCTTGSPEKSTLNSLHGKDSFVALYRLFCDLVTTTTENCLEKDHSTRRYHMIDGN